MLLSAQICTGSQYLEHLVAPSGYSRWTKSTWGHRAIDVSKNRSPFPQMMNGNINQSSYGPWLGEGVFISLDWKGSSIVHTTNQNIALK